MVWDQQATVVVQLNPLVENGKVVGSRYWPTRGLWHQIPAHTSRGILKTRTRTLEFGAYRVRLKRETAVEGYCTTVLKLWQGPLGPRTVHHLWLTGSGSGPGSGAAASGLQPAHVRLWNDIVECAAALRLAGTPVIAHCATGVEHSALFVGLCLLHAQLQRTGQADVLAALCQLRRDRGQCITTAVRDHPLFGAHRPTASQPPGGPSHCLPSVPRTVAHLGRHSCRVCGWGDAGTVPVLAPGRFCVRASKGRPAGPPRDAA